MRTAILMLSLMLSLPAGAALDVFACEPEWATLTEAVAGDRADIHTAIAPDQDAHRVEARPSLIAQVRRADLVICTGAGLETGWLPTLLDRARNPAVRKAPGLFLAADQVELLEQPEQLNRSEGDIHGAGNPHVHLDPLRMADIARALGRRLGELDKANAGHYRDKAEDFAAELEKLADELFERAEPLRGMAVVVHHRSWRYLLDWLGLVRAAELEPKPGVPPSPGHLASLVDRVKAQKARLILYRGVNDDRAAQWLAQRSSACAVELPFTVGEQDTADLPALYNRLVERLIRAREACNDDA